MKKLEELRNYVLENNFKMIYLNNKLNVINYQAIEHFDNNKIMIKVDKLLVIEGKNLVVTKLLEDEIQIEGSIKKIEFRWAYEE